MVDVSVPDNRLFFSCAGSGLTLALVRVRYDTMPEQEKSAMANLSPVFEYIKIVRPTSGRKYDALSYMYLAQVEGTAEKRFLFV